MDVYTYLCMTGDFDWVKKSIINTLRQALVVIQSLKPNQDVLIDEAITPVYDQLTLAMKYASSMGEFEQVKYLVEGPLTLIELFTLTHLGQSVVRDLLLPLRRRLMLLGEFYASEVRDYHIADYLSVRKQVSSPEVSHITYAMELTMK